MMKTGTTIHCSGADLEVFFLPPAVMNHEARDATSSLPYRPASLFHTFCVDLSLMISDLYLFIFLGIRCFDYQPFANPPAVNPCFSRSILSPFFSLLPLRLSVSLFLFRCSHTWVQSRGAIRSRSLPSDLSLVISSLRRDSVLAEAVGHMD